jgi:hypothetical protein
MKINWWNAGFSFVICVVGITLAHLSLNFTTIVGIGLISFGVNINIWEIKRG